MSNKEEAIAYWFQSAANDLKTAQSLFDTGHYDWCLFLLHLVLEKTIKGLLVERDLEIIHTHDLPLLIQKLEIEINPDKLSEIDEINSFNLEARYDDYKFKFFQKATKDYTSQWKDKCEEFYSWLLNQRIQK